MPCKDNFEFLKAIFNFGRFEFEKTDHITGIIKIKYMEKTEKYRTGGVKYESPACSVIRFEEKNSILSGSGNTEMLGEEIGFSWDEEEIY